MTKKFPEVTIDGRRGDTGKYRVDCPCCEDNHLVGAVYLSFTEKEWDDFHVGDLPPETPPRWFVAPTDTRHVKKGSGPYDLEFIGPREAKFCPFCGKPVPPVRKKKKKFKRVARVTDGGYYCDTCRERLDGCRCVPPHFLWEAGVEEPKPRDINEGRCPSVSDQGLRCGQAEGHDGPHTALGPSDAPWFRGEG
jgi:hypothetical protein